MNHIIEDTKDDFFVFIPGNDTFNLVMKIITANFSTNHENHCMNKHE